MDFSNELATFASGQIGGIVIYETGSGTVVYADEFFKERYGRYIVGEVADILFHWFDSCPELFAGKLTVWEQFDREKKAYYKMFSSRFEKDGKDYSIHKLEDITEYKNLDKDFNEYKLFFKKISEFQNSVLKIMNESYTEILPMLADFFKTNKTYIFFQYEDKIGIVSYNTMTKEYSKSGVAYNDENAVVFDYAQKDALQNFDLPEDIKNAFVANGANLDNSIRFLSGGEISNKKFAIYLNVWPSLDEQSLSNQALGNAIKLYIENCLMRTKMEMDK